MGEIDHIFLYTRYFQIIARFHSITVNQRPRNSISCRDRDFELSIELPRDAQDLMAPIPKWRLSILFSRFNHPLFLNYPRDHKTPPPPTPTPTPTTSPPSRIAISCLRAIRKMPVDLIGRPYLPSLFDYGSKFNSPFSEGKSAHANQPCNVLGTSYLVSAIVRTRRAQVFLVIDFRGPCRLNSLISTLVDSGISNITKTGKRYTWQ